MGNDNGGRVAKVRKAKYLDYEINIGTDETPEEVKANLSEIFPEVAHSEVSQDENGNVLFTVMAGTKG